MQQCNPLISARVYRQYKAPQSTRRGNRCSKKKQPLLDIDWKKHLLKTAKQRLKISPTPLKTLQSSSISKTKNTALKKIRQALGDAQNTALLALAYYVYNDDAYLNQAKKYLLAWANTHQPNGHPINETRLEGFLWAYDLLFCEFTSTEHRIIKIWLLNIQKNKHNWKFAPSSEKNNRRSHQLKILLMVDRLLEDEKSLNEDKETLRQHLNNTVLKEGVSIDYRERDALHYHTDNLEPWLEIALLYPYYLPKVTESYHHLIKQIKGDNLHQQFTHSKQKIDQKRAKNGSFDTKRITRSVIAFNTLKTTTLDKDLLKHLSKKEVKQSLLFHYIRYYLWDADSQK